LKRGIKAKKFHYTRLKSKEVTVKFVDNSCIQWSKLNKEGQLKKGRLRLSEIEGVIFGGFGSTFWQYKPKILQLIVKQKFNEIPFFAWNCISIKGKERTIDLSIENRSSMLALLRLI